MRITSYVAFIATVLVLHAGRTAGHPAVLPDKAKELWQATPEVTQPPAGMPDFYRPSVARQPQPLSGVHVPGPKNHAKVDEQDGSANFNLWAAQNKTAPGYQTRMSAVKGIISVLDPNKQSPLNTGQPLVFPSVNSPYTPNTNLFDVNIVRTPLVTNKWWQNLIIEKGVDPIHPHPYMVKCLSKSSVVGFPKFQASKNAFTSSQPPDWEISDASGALTKRQVTAFDALGVEVTWSGKSAASMKSRFYKGFPLLTYEMNSMAPSLKTIHAILKVQQLGRTINSYKVNTSENATRLARQMVEQPSLTQITLNDNSEWLIVSKPTIVWKNSGNGMLVQQNPGAYSGVVQIAHLGDKPAENINVLQKYAGNYPIEASITYAKVENKQNVGRSSDVVFFYKPNTGNGGDTSRVFDAGEVSAAVTLLSLVLPHHVDLLPKEALLSPGLSGYRSAKGPLTAVVGNIISYSQPLQTVSFDGAQKISPSDKAEIQHQLLRDLAINTNITAPDPYFFGKGIAKIARLYQIAQEIGDSTSAYTLSTKLVAHMTPWLITKNNDDPLVYDSSWGGIVSTKGLADPGADFGQGRYNDHHFHYGYFLYAGAILAKYDINAFAPFREALNQMLRDYANPTYIDTQFPYMRHFDPYDGHSWAAGLFTFGDGRNQESSGEAVNAYYSAYLYALATGLQETADFYEIILNMEATSGRRYWHPTRVQSKELFGEPFVHNAVGILWASKADYPTFFGANPEYIYGIQMLPFTPATKLLVTAEWVKDAWCPEGSSACADGMQAAAEQAGNNAWANLLYTAYSLVDRNTAWNKVIGSTPDDGNTLTNAMHWIATSGKQGTDVK
ncbi:hypothetical protein LPJ66_001782 [Kickxella alabastrina]|uniref:Uncharacterized protein n=1 Tax=Kickxella alabastrina TaxID=61397 RepID=A0ACC1ISJ7_9FUNG|nr:hypothetical protein LPJ66_001782 [Kickxella alabastrina]